MDEVIEEKTPEQLEAEKLAQEELEGFESVDIGDDVPLTEEEKTARDAARAEADRAQKEADAQAAEEAKAKEAEEAKKVTPIPSQLTTEQLNQVLAQASTIAEVREAVNKMQRDSAGRIGSLEHTIKELQAATPVGKAIEVKPEDIANFTKEFPELGPKLAEDLTKVLSKFKGTGETPKVETQEEFEARVGPIAARAAHEAVLNEQKRTAPKILASRHKDYSVIFGAPDSNTEWRQWLKTQPGDYEKRMLESWDGFELADSLDQFKAHQETVRIETEKREKAEKEKAERLKKAPSVRADRLREAIPARGGSVVQTKPQAKSEQEAFDAVFKE